MSRLDPTHKPRIWVLTQKRNEYDAGPEMIAWWGRPPTEEQVESAIIAAGDTDHRLNPFELMTLTSDGGKARATYMSWYSHYSYHMETVEEAD